MQTVRQARAAPADVDDEQRLDLKAVAACSVAPAATHTANLPTVQQQAFHLMPGEPGDAWQGPHAAAHDLLDERARTAAQHDVGAMAREPAEDAQHLEIEPHIHGHRAAGFQLVGEAGEQRLEIAQAAYQQVVQMAGLRNATPRRGVVGQLVTLDRHDLVDMPGQHLRCAQAGHAAAHYDDATAAHWAGPTLGAAAFALAS